MLALASTWDEDLVNLVAAAIWDRVQGSVRRKDTALRSLQVLQLALVHVVLCFELVSSLQYL